MVTFSRPGFAASEYGQKEWKSAGYPIFLEEPAAAFLQMRLRRLGAISGTVLDEEEIGMPDHEVAVYRDKRPPELIGRVKTDDRGVYRMGGLMPGSYLARTVGKHYDEGDYLPTFHRESQEIADAQGAQVMLDEQVNNINLKPKAGRLVTIEGSVLGGFGDPLITVVSDTGRVEQRGHAFRFEHMPPGQYEIYVQLEGESLGGYADLAAIKDLNRVSIQLVEASVSFQFSGASAREVQVLTRKKDLAGTGPIIRYPLGTQSTVLAPGRWEFMLSVPPNLYPSTVQGPRYRNNPRERPDGWIEMLITRPTSIRYFLSNKSASITGGVTTSGREPVAGAPVFLETWDPVERKRVVDLRETRTDLRGQYRFTGLAPGTYRILSTFEYRSPDSESMDAAGAKEIRVVEAQSPQLDLDLYVIR